MHFWCKGNLCVAKTFIIAYRNHLRISEFISRPSLSSFVQNVACNYLLTNLIFSLFPLSTTSTEFCFLRLNNRCSSFASTDVLAVQTNPLVTGLSSRVTSHNNFQIFFTPSFFFVEQQVVAQKALRNTRCVEIVYEEVLVVSKLFATRRLFKFSNQILFVSSLRSIFIITDIMVSLRERPQKLPTPARVSKRIQTKVRFCC